MAPPKKIVIVDDQPEILESISMLVEALGYEAVPVSDPSRIIDHVAEEGVLLLLQDLRMPQLNVAGLVAGLRSDPRTEHVPLVFCSADDNVSTKAARYDAYGFLAKPFSAEQLTSLLRTVDREQDHHGDLRYWTHRNLQREVQEAFHGQWNLMAALANYMQVVREATDDPVRVKRVMRRFEETLLALESRTDHLHAYLRDLISALEPVLDPKEEDRRQAARDPAAADRSGASAANHADAAGHPNAVRASRDLRASGAPNRPDRSGAAGARDARGRSGARGAGSARRSS